MHPTSPPSPLASVPDENELLLLAEEIRTRETEPPEQFERQDQAADDAETLFYAGVNDGMVRKIAIAPIEPLKLLDAESHFLQNVLLCALKEPAFLQILSLYLHSPQQAGEHGLRVIRGENGPLKNVLAFIPRAKPFLTKLKNRAALIQTQKEDYIQTLHASISTKEAALTPHAHLLSAFLLETVCLIFKDFYTTEATNFIFKDLLKQLFFSLLESQKEELTSEHALRLQNLTIEMALARLRTQLCFLSLEVLGDLRDYLANDSRVLPKSPAEEDNELIRDLLEFIQATPSEKREEVVQNLLQTIQNQL